MTGSLDIARRIVERKQYEEHDGVIVDLQTAGAIVAVGDALNEENRAKLDSLPIGRAGAIAWKLVR